MTTNFSRLARKYEAAEAAVSQAIEMETEDGSPDLAELDRVLRMAYGAMISEDLANPTERLERITYLLGIMEKLEESGAMRSELSAAILRDATTLCKTQSVNTEYMAAPANIDRAVRILSMCS